MLVCSLFEATSVIEPLPRQLASRVAECVRELWESGVGPALATSQSALIIQALDDPELLECVYEHIDQLWEKGCYRDQEEGDVVPMMRDTGNGAREEMG